MKNKTILFILLLSIGSLHGQSVVSSGGQSGSSNELHASATVGEAIIGARSNGAIFSNQGFQQPLQSDITSTVEISSQLKIELSIGPIPTYNVVQITIDKPVSGSFLLTDQLGKTVKKLPLKNSQLKHTFDLSQLNAATYYLTLVSDDGRKLTTVPVVKI